MTTKSAKSRFRHADRVFGRAPLSLTLVLLVAVAAVWTPAVHAQAPEKSSRKIVATVKPEYPAALQHAQIGGLVRLTATVLPNGTVSKVQIRGGNPVLAESAAAAVMKWKYAPSATETNEEVSVSFNPH